MYIADQRMDPTLGDGPTGPKRITSPPRPAAAGPRTATCPTARSVPPEPRQRTRTASVSPNSSAAVRQATRSAASPDRPDAATAPYAAAGSIKVASVPNSSDVAGPPATTSATRPAGACDQQGSRYNRSHALAASIASR